MSLIAKRPWISLVVVAATFALMTDTMAEIREEPGGRSPGWLVALVLGLMAAGAVNTFLFPRFMKMSNERVAAGSTQWKVVYVQWASAIAIYMNALFAWFIFDAPDWLVVLGGSVASPVLVVLIATSRDSYKALAGQSR